MIEDTLHRYARQDVPPSALTTAKVLVNARRRTRRRTRLLGAAAAAVAVLATVGAVTVVRTLAGPPITPAGAGCLVDPLDLPAGTTGGVMATGIDPSGRYVIGLTGSRDAPRAVLWTNGTAAVLPEAFAPQAVNPAGLVVGYTGPVRHGAEKQQRPVVYDGTRLVPLPLPDGGVGGAAYAVNTHGDVLGTVVHADGSAVAVRWRTTGTVAIGSTVAGASGMGLTDDGVAVGFRQPPAQALRWSADGVTRALPVPRGAESAAALAAAGDWAVGDAEVAPTGDKDHDLASRTVRWNLRTGAAELISGFGGYRVSASGTIAGLTDTSAPALWRNGRIRTLPLPSGGRTGFGSSLSGITADGHDLVGGVEVSAGAVATVGPVGDAVASQHLVPVVWRGC